MRLCSTEFKLRLASQSPIVDSLNDAYTNGWAAMGRLIRAGSSWSGRERNCSFLNLGDGRFADVSAISGLDFADDGRVLAAADCDRDGDVDLWLKNRTGPQLRFMQNDGAGGHFLSIRLAGLTCNRDAVGARVEIDAGGSRRIQTVTAGSGYLGQSSKAMHFGLGPWTKIDQVAVRWPDGSTEVLPPMEADHHYTYQQSSGNLRALPRRQFKDGVPAEVERPDLPAVRRIILREPMPLPADSVEGSSVANGTVTLVVFWANWCPNCRGELIEFTREDQRLRAAGDRRNVSRIRSLSPHQSP
jgi:hypothetical protein